MTRFTRHVLVSIAAVACFTACRSESDNESKGRSASTVSSAQAKTTITASDRRSRVQQPYQSAGASANASQKDSTSTGKSESVCKIYGKITDVVGKPAAGVTVSLHAPPRHNEFFDLHTICSTQSSKDGSYELTTNNEQAFLISVKHNVPELMFPIWDERDSINLASGKAIEKNIKLPPSRPVSGKVINAAGQPVTGAPVHLQPKSETWSTFLPASSETTTTAQGEFTFPYVVDGSYNIGTASKGYAPVTSALAVPTSQSIQLMLSSKGGTVMGRVLLKSDDSPVSGVLVVAVPQHSDQLLKLEMVSQATALDGTFRFDNVSSGMKKLVLMPAQNAELGLTAPLPQPVSLAEGETTDIVLYAYPGHTLSGQVFDKLTSEPIAGVKISVSGRDRLEAISDASGRYQIPHIWASDDTSFHVSAIGSGYVMDGGSDGLVRHEVTALANQTQIQKDIPMIRLLKIKGQVTTRDGTSVTLGRAIFKAIDGATHSADEMALNPDGTFEVYARPFSKGVVVVTAEGFAQAESALQALESRDVAGLKIVLDPGATLQGKVVLPDGTKASGASVMRRIKRNYGGTDRTEIALAATCDHNGLFRLYGLPTEIELYAKLNGYSRSEHTALSLNPGEIRSDVVLKLQPVREISGRVVNSDMTPIASASVQCSGADIHENTSTDKDGRFVLTNLSDGSYAIQVYATHGNKRLEGIRAGTNDLEIIIQGERKYTLIGLVVDDATDEPIKDFKVDEPVEMLSEPGKFKLGNLGLNSWDTIRISSPIHEEQAFALLPQSQPQEFVRTFRLGTGSVVTGRLVDAATREPVPGVTVINWGGIPFWLRQRSGHKGAATTDAEGRFTIGPVPSGDNELQFQAKPPYSDLIKKIVVKSEEPYDMGDVELGQGGSIRGKVVRGPAEEPVPTIEVTLSARIANIPLSKSASTDSQGMFEFTNLSPGQYNVGAAAVGKQIRLEAAEAKDVILQLGGTTVRGTVTRAGETIDNVQVIAHGDEQSFKGSTRNGGVYELTDVIPGKYSFEISRSGVSKRENVEVPDQPVFEKNFVMPDGRLQVSVVNDAGDPVPGATVALTQKNSGSGMDQRWQTQKSLTEATNSAGQVQYTGLNKGTYSIQARKDGDGTALNPNVEIQDDQTQQIRLELSKEGGTLVSVAVSYTTGNGIPEAWCYLFGPGGNFPHNSGRDPAGIMKIENIPPGTYTTNVSYWSHSQSEKTVELKAGETVTIEDVLYPAGALQWTLKLADGKPAGGATVTVRPLSTTPEERERTGHANGGGLFVERGLAPGTYQVTAELPGKSPYTETHTIGAGANTIKETLVPGW